MKYAITTILAAALASAAVVPAATAATAAAALPANFQLKFTTPVAKSPLKAYEGLVTIDDYIGRKSSTSHIRAHIHIHEHVADTFRHPKPRPRQQPRPDPGYT